MGDQVVSYVFGARDEKSGIPTLATGSVAARFPNCRTIGTSTVPTSSDGKLRFLAFIVTILLYR
jgi:hypothetical protein